MTSTPSTDQPSVGRFVILMGIVWTLGPLLYWAVSFCLSPQFDVGTVWVLAVGIPASYLLFGFSLFIVSAAMSGVALGLARLRLVWLRLVYGVVPGAAFASLLGLYTA